MSGSSTRRLAQLKAAEDQEQRRAEVHAAHRRKRLHLSWDEAADGEECRGCRRALLTQDKFKPSDQLTKVERHAITALGDAFKSEHHADCFGRAWTWGTNMSWHCAECCPEPPADPQVMERAVQSFAKAVRASGKTHIHEVELTCGHVVRVSTSVERQEYAGTTRCFACDRLRSVVNSHVVEEPVVDRQASDVRRRLAAAEKRRRTAAAQAQRLEDEVAQLRRELDSGQGGER